MTVGNSETRIAYPPGAHEFTLGFKWGSCCSIFNFVCSVSCRALFDFLSFFLWSLYCLYFNLRLPMTTLVFFKLVLSCYTTFHIRERNHPFQRDI